jgi:hypothetical protein
MNLDWQIISKVCQSRFILIYNNVSIYLYLLLYNLKEEAGFPYLPL